MTYGPDWPEYLAMTAITRDRVLAAFNDGATTKAQLADALGVSEFDAELARVLFHLAEDHQVSVHADGTIRRYRSIEEE
jgi:hypothetical protein